MKEGSWGYRGFRIPRDLREQNLDPEEAKDIASWKEAEGSLLEYMCVCGTKDTLYKKAKVQNTKKRNAKYQNAKIQNTKMEKYKIPKYKHRP